MLLFLSIVLLLLIEALAVMLLLLSVTLLVGTAVVVAVRNIILDCLALLAWSGSRLSSHPDDTFVT
jgi:hypothetical protein